MESSGWQCVLEGKNTYIDTATGAALPEYASLKFRPGSGNMSDFNVSSSLFISDDACGRNVFYRS